jgi:phosphatidylserine decarboxylase
MQKFSWSDPPSQTAFPLARAGYPFIFACAGTTAVFALLGLVPWAVIGLAVTFFICYFFRDPDRVVPSGEGLVVSPADGRVLSVTTVDGTPFYPGQCQKISIFMSVFNVHVNRIPHEGRIVRIDYHPGKFFSANLDKASKDNERNAVHLETQQGRPICCVQIAGLIARRIICHVQQGDQVRRGQRFGLICFGSRLDVYLPMDAKLRVAQKDCVKAGTTVLGDLGP